MRTPFFLFGIAFILVGVFEICCIVGIIKLKTSKDKLWEEYFTSENARKAMKVIGLVFYFLFVLLGMYLLLKGIFDPSKGIAIHF